MLYEKERAQLCALCHRMFDRKLVSGADGNVSLRLPDDAMLITPSGVCKGFLELEQLLVQGFSGEIREGSLRSTKEAGIHAALYQGSGKAMAVLHTHAPYATAFANLGGLPEDVLVEVPVLLGRPALVGYAKPGSALLAEQVAANAENPVILMQNHGVIVTGTTAEQAFAVLDGLENAAQSIAVSLLLGASARIPRAEAEALVKK